MKPEELDVWIAGILPKHQTLTQSVMTIMENLLDKEEIDYLAVTGRTKSPSNINEKIKRKSYKDPPKDLTDISGIRVIVYLESDVERVSKIIQNSFKIDDDNSMDKQDLLASDQIGYRSVHYVCDLGKQRAQLPEFKGLSGLKFEFQVRTVLQHAWAELAHDRDYKFGGKLPNELERQLYLYAGMLEIADKGFDQLSQNDR